MLPPLKDKLPPGAARLAKRIGVHIRYRWQAARCRQGYRRYGSIYNQHIMFVAGLPKSGTTWLERMLASYQGFHNILIPDATAYELTTSGSHDYDLPRDIFSRFNNMLVLTKMHVHGSKHNVRLLQEAGINYVILYRDLRDVAVSHYFYTRQTPWHPEYPLYAPATVAEGLQLFAERTLLPFAAWVRSWEENRDYSRSIVLRYEEMLADPHNAFTQVAKLFELDGSPAVVNQVIERHSFAVLSGGRKLGEQNTKSFFRKGMAGDWKNHFTEDIKRIYKERIGDFLIEYGYEKDFDW
jgi:hypothetical protein